MPPPKCAALSAAGESCGVLFGPERTGLVNDDIALADTVLTVPLNPAFASLNLAQAVLIVGYEWFTAQAEAPPETMHHGHSRAATKEELLRFFDHFEEALVDSGFLRHPDKRPSMTRNLRNLFQRAQCTEQELRTLHGVITAFMGPRKRGAAPDISGTAAIQPDPSGPGIIRRLPYAAAGNPRSSSVARRRAKAEGSGNCSPSTMRA